MKNKNIWKEGGFVDLWSVNHVMAGALLGGAFFFLSIILWKAMLIGVTLMIIWEFYETIHGIKETFLNRVTDVIVGGFGLSSFYLLSSKIDILFSILVYVVMLIVWIILQKWGYTYLNKEYNAKK